MWLSGAEVTGAGGSGQVQCVQKVKGRRVQGRAALLMGVEDKAGQVWAASGCLLGAGSGPRPFPGGFQPSCFAALVSPRMSSGWDGAEKAGRRPASMDDTLTHCWSPYRSAD